MININNPAERLLEVMSCWGNFSLDKYYLAFEEMGLATQGEALARHARGRYLRALEAVAFCDVDYQQRRIQMAAPVVALLPGGGYPRAVLTGARSPALLRDLAQNHTTHKVSMTRQEQRTDHLPLPDAIYLNAPRRADLQALAEQLRVGMILDNAPAWQIAHTAAGLYEYEQSLEWGPVPVLPDGAADEFDTGMLHGVRFRFQGQLPTRRLLSYASETTTLLQTWWVEADRAALVDRDWGRYLALRSASRHVFFFDPLQQTLAIPAGAPLPSLFARSLTLCVGHVPDTRELRIPGLAEKTWFTTYTETPEPIVRLVADKLGQMVRLLKGKKQ